MFYPLILTDMAQTSSTSILNRRKFNFSFTICRDGRYEKLPIGEMTLKQAQKESRHVAECELRESGEDTAVFIVANRYFDMGHVYAGHNDYFVCREPLEESVADLIEYCETK